MRCLFTAILFLGLSVLPWRWLRADPIPTVPAKTTLSVNRDLLQTLDHPVLPHAAPWKIENGCLANTDRTQADVVALRQGVEYAGDVQCDGDVQITEGDVAGLVIRASDDGSSCYGVLLGAESQNVRLVSLPWTGEDRAHVPAPIKRGQPYRLSVVCRTKADGIHLSVALDGHAMLDFFDPSPSTQVGSRFGVLVNNSKARFHHLSAQDMSMGGKAKPLFQDDFAHTPIMDYVPFPTKPFVPFHAAIQDGLITLSAQLPKHGMGEGAISQFQHGITDARHVWLPHLAPEPGYVIADHAFRSPAILLSNNKTALAVIPDLDDVAAISRSGLRVWLDYDHAARTITVAAGNYQVGGFHVGYQMSPATYQGQKVTLRLHVLTSTRPEDLSDPYGLAARWLWQRWGHPRHVRGGSQHTPLTRYSAYVSRWAFTPEPHGWADSVWQAFSVNGHRCGAPAFIVDVAQHPSVPRDQRRWREQKSVWNQLWFSTQRSADGLLRYARQTHSPDLARRAALMTQIALAAPQTHGLFPAVYTAGGGGYSLDRDTPSWDKAHWTNSDRRPPGVSADACHILDAAYTCRLLLEWHDLNPRERRTLPYVQRFADRLCALQRPSGAFPGWVEPDGHVPSTLAEGPESAMGATLLLELSSHFPQQTRYREAAQKALRYLEAGPIRQSRWEDFETYFSCSRWGSDHVGRIVARNGVYKSNSLSPFWCAEAFLMASRVLNKPHDLTVGRRCLDELSLYQQVWDPPWIPASCHGGFGVMNGDGEWDDARQSLFAPLYLDYYVATGEPDYFERGVSALRASFAMLYCPENTQVRGAYEKAHPMFGPESYGFMMENIAHGGPGANEIGPFTIYDWGNGAALATAALIRDKYGDVFIDTPRAAAFGIDGCAADVQGDTVHIRDRYQRSSLLAHYGNGVSRPVALINGVGIIPLSPSEIMHAHSSEGF